MASGWEIFLIVFLLLLVIAGIILAIYFVWRHDQNKRKGPTSAPGNGGGTNGPTGATGPTGPTNLIPGNFSISPEANANAYMTFQTSGNVLIPTTTTVTSGIPCSSFSWQNTSNPESALALTSPGGNIYISRQGNNLVMTATPSEATGWRYNSSDKTWCNINQSNLCLFYDIDNGGIVSFRETSASPSQNFRWDNVSPVTNCSN